MVLETDVARALEFWDNPDDFPDSLSFQLHTAADGKARILTLSMRIEGLQFDLSSLVMGEC